MPNNDSIQHIVDAYHRLGLTSLKYNNPENSQPFNPKLILLSTQNESPYLKLSDFLRKTTDPLDTVVIEYGEHKKADARTHKLENRNIWFIPSDLLIKKIRESINIQSIKKIHHPNDQWDESVKSRLRYLDDPLQYLVALGECSRENIKQLQEKESHYQFRTYVLVIGDITPIINHFKDISFITNYSEASETEPVTKNL